jgi:hypothetical protein
VTDPHPPLPSWRDWLSAGLEYTGLLVGSIAGGAIFAAAVFGEPPSTPDPQLTPGAVATSDPAVLFDRINGQTYSQRHRIWHDKMATCRKYGIVRYVLCKATEDDDRVPVCLGGDNADPRNHWAQPLAEAHVKDGFEDWACRTAETAYRNGTDAAEEVARLQAIFLGDWQTSTEWRAYIASRSEDGR